MALSSEADDVAAIEKAVGLVVREQDSFSLCRIDAFEQAGYVWLQLSFTSSSSTARAVTASSAEASKPSAYPVVEDDFEFCLTRTLLETMDISLARHVSSEAVVLRFGCQIDTQPELPLSLT